jgi:hypothetical protein
MDALDAACADAVDLVAQRGDALERFLPEDLARVRLEREHGGYKAKSTRRLNNLPEERLVAEMHSVEVSDGQSAVEPLPGAGQSAKDVSGGEKINHQASPFMLGS